LFGFPFDGYGNIGFYNSGFGYGYIGQPLTWYGVPALPVYSWRDPAICNLGSGPYFPIDVGHVIYGFIGWPPYGPVDGGIHAVGIDYPQIGGGSAFLPVFKF
jgi:hypothetical protein